MALPIGSFGKGPAPVAAPKATPIQNAASAMGAAKAAQLAPRLNISPGPGLTAKGAAAERLTVGKQPLVQAYSPPAAKGSARPAKAPSLASGLNPAAMRGAMLANEPGLGIVDRLVSQIVTLPSSTIRGVIGLGAAAAHDAGNGSWVHDITDPLGNGTVGNTGLPTFQHGGDTALQSALSGAVHSDPVYQAVTKGSLAPLAQNPLGTLLDAGGLLGITGRAAGALARTGALGDEVKAAAALGGRPARVVLPGAPETDIPRGYSPNLLVQQLQKRADGASVPLLGHPLDDMALRQQVAAMHTAENGQLVKESDAFSKALKAAKPKSQAEQIASVVTARTGMGREGLYRIYSRMADEPIPKDPEAADAHIRTLENLRTAVQADVAGKLDWNNVYGAAAQIKPLAELQESQKAALGQASVDEMQRHLDNERALVEPDVHFLQHPVKDPRLVSVLKDQRDLVKAKEEALQQARTEHDRAVGAGESDRVPALRATVDHAQQELDAAKAAHDVVKSVVKTHKMQGTVVEDPTVPIMTSGPLKGLRVRPLTADDAGAVRQGFRISGETGAAYRVGRPDPAHELQSYVSNTNPERRAALSAREAFGVKNNEVIASMAERGNKAATGEALKAGDLRSGWDAVSRTLLTNAQQIAEERETQAIIDRFEIKNPNRFGIHEPFPTPADAKIAARQYEAEHGVPLATIEHNGVLHNVPQVVVRELNRQRSLDRPTAFGKLLTKPNKWFRNTVLPYSPKLPIMHNVENPSRVMLAERGNLPNIVRDWRGAHAVFDHMTPAQREQLHTLLTPGAHVKWDAAGAPEDLGRLPGETGPVESWLRARSILPGERGLPTATIRAVAKANESLASRIIHAQRFMEQHVQSAVIGQHLRQVMQEWGLSYREAQHSFGDYAEKLAQHLATPADAERAARAMQDALGKYNAFTANSREALRLAPFASWYVNAAKLVYITLPRDHPLFDSLIQNTASAIDQQWQAQHQGLPSDMQDSLSVGPNAWLDVSKFGPLPPGDSAVKTVANLVLPEFQSPALALTGKDPFMADLRGPDTGFGQSASPNGIQSASGSQRAQAILSAIDQIVGNEAGPINDAARLAYGRGGVFYNTAAPGVHLLSGGLLGTVDVKPGSTKDQKGWLNLPGGLDKVLDPFHPTTYGSSKTNYLGAAEGSLGAPTSGGLGKPEGHL